MNTPRCTLQALLFFTLAAALIGGGTTRSAAAAEFASQWENSPNRTWIGPDYWANRLQDWRIAEGRLECIAADPRTPQRTLHLLTLETGPAHGGFSAAVKIGRTGNENAEAFAGFLFGVGAGMDYRSRALIQGNWGAGAGYLVAVTGNGRILIRDHEAAPGKADTWASEPGEEFTEGTLRVQVAPERGVKRVRVEAELLNAKGEKVASASALPAEERFSGGVALIAHSAAAQRKAGSKFWFQDLALSGDGVLLHADRALGPILSTQYTLSRGVLKLTAQLMPVGDEEPRRVELVLPGSSGKPGRELEAELIVPGYTATFRVPNWDSAQEQPYTVVYPAKNGAEAAHTWSGTIRRDPVDQETIVVAGFTGNHNNRHGFSQAGYNFAENIWFPHADVAGNVAKHKPDLLFFSGDQVYEGDSPTVPDAANIKLDYLYKWYLWCWAYRDLTREIPSICLPDDHDVFQGNVWGQGGRKSPGRDHDGGYVHPADFVQMVDRTQMSHLPDPFDPEPIDQGIHSYATAVVWGRVGVAVIEDRKFQNGCNRDDLPPSGTGRPDHFNDPDFEIAKLDLPGLSLLGKQQEAFLAEFGRDWRGQDMKMAVSQTIFANMATHHGGGLQRLIADLDSNGWPQSGSNRAVDLLRRGFTFHLGGDQHLATIVHHGIEEHGDAMWSFCVPSVANFYPRAWAPKLPGAYSFPAPEDYTGKHRDGFNHPVTVYAATNPGEDRGREPKSLHNGMPGYGIVRLNKPERKITMECWPRYADPTDPKAEQYLGWPKTIGQFDNYARTPKAHLATLAITGPNDPVVQVTAADTGEMIYTVRILGREFRPPVFAEGTYNITISDPDRGRSQQLNGIKSGSTSKLEIDLR